MVVNVGFEIVFDGNQELSSRDNMGKGLIFAAIPGRTPFVVMYFC